MRRSVLLVALFAFTAVPAFADAPSASTSQTAEGGNAFKQPGGMFDASEQPRPFLIGAFLEFPYGYWYGGFPLSVGGRFYIPLLKQGFVPSLNDEFGLDVGVDLTLTFGYGVSFLIDIPVEAMWKLNLTSKFSAYAKLGVGLGIRLGYWTSFCGGAFGYGYSCWPVAPTFYGSVGAIYKLTDGLWLRGEIGYPGLKIGLTFPL